MAPMPPRALAQPLSHPSPDQTTVRHLRLAVLRVVPTPHGQHLIVQCGGLGFDLHIPGSPGFKPGDELVMEHHKDDNPMACDPLAIYPSHLKPTKEQAVSTLSATAIVTMTSLEMVEYINSQRKDGEAKIAHSDFLKKVPIVLGDEVAGKFSCYYKASNGKQNPMYRFPKREATLMAMSYSYELQAQVYDHMTRLEEAQRAIPPQQKARAARIPNAMRTQVSALLMIGKAMSKVKGVNESLATACTLDAIERTTGLPATLLTKALPAVDIEDAATLNPTQVGESMNMSGRSVNNALEKMGLQYRDEAKNWKLTEAGTAYGEMKPFHKNGHSGYEIRWKPSVIDVVRNSLTMDTAD